MVRYRRSCALALGLSITAWASRSAFAQEIQIGGPEIVTANTNPSCDEYNHQADGSWPVLPNANGTSTLVFWGNHESHRISVSSFYGSSFPFGTLTDGQPGDPNKEHVIGAGARGFWNGSTWSYGAQDNGGAWLYNVIRVGSNLYGFYHSEDHDWPGYTAETPDDYSWVPWASVSLAKSTDDGVTWTKLGQRVATDKSHPAVGSDPAWGGTGGNTTRYDHINDRWVMVYHTFSWGGLRMAATLDSDPEGAFYKYHNGGFSEPALTPTVVNGSRIGGGDSHLEGLRDVLGATQANLHFNTYLDKWVVCFRSGTDFYFSTTTDLCDPNWSKPKLFFSSPTQQIMYPCIIGDTAQHGIQSQFAGQNATLVYARWPNLNPNPNRIAVRVPITFNMNPNADFSASATTTPVKRSVQFTDLSTNQPTSWSWTFGDGGTSTEQNPVHEYTTAGVYTVTLTAANSYLPGGNVESKSGYITVGVPETDFHAKSTSGTFPFTASFRDRSTATPISWSWTFGDSGTSTEQHPTHTYAAAGTYTVTLTATNANGSQTRTKTGYVTVGAQTAPTATFVAYPRSGGLGMKVQFTDTSTNAPQSWAWTFGDGGTSAERNPVHEYTAAGNYTVTLTATNANGNDVESKTSHISVVSSAVTSASSFSTVSYGATNGNGGWWYYEWTGSQYLPMTFNSSTGIWEGTGSDGNGTNTIYQWGQTSTDHQSARVYVAQRPGQVRIRTNGSSGFGRSGDKGGDGFTAYISLASAAALAGTASDVGTTLFQKYYVYDATAYDNIAITVTVKEGDGIVFRSDMGTNWGWDTFVCTMDLQETWGGAPPTADFVATTATTGTAPLDVAFSSSASSADVFAYAWDFDGDGVIDSTEANPTYRFKYAGPNDVTLKVYGTYGMDVMTRSAYVRPTGTVSYHSIGADDGFVYESAANSGVGGTVVTNLGGMWGITTGDDAQNRRLKGFVSFDTSWIPDNAVIDTVTLVVEHDDDSIAGAPGLLGPLFVDVKTGTFNNQALESADWQATPTAASVASRDFKIAQYPPTNVVNLGFNAAGRAATNTTGLTQCRLWWNDGTDGDAVNDVMGFFPGNSPTVAKRAKLSVKFH